MNIFRVCDSHFGIACFCIAYCTIMFFFTCINIFFNGCVGCPKAAYCEPSETFSFKRKRFPPILAVPLDSVRPIQCARFPVPGAWVANYAYARGSRWAALPRKRMTTRASSRMTRTPANSLRRSLTRSAESRPRHWQGCDTH